MRYGIPEYRLPKKVLDWEIEGILDMGIKAKTGTRLGRDLSKSRRWSRKAMMPFSWVSAPGRIMR